MLVLLPSFFAVFLSNRLALLSKSRGRSVAVYPFVGYSNIILIMLFYIPLVSLRVGF